MFRFSVIVDLIVDFRYPCTLRHLLPTIPMVDSRVEVDVLTLDIFHTYK